MHLTEQTAQKALTWGLHSNATDNATDKAEEVHS